MESREMSVMYMVMIILAVVLGGMVVMYRRCK
jgi:hypothetical protein